MIREFQFHPRTKHEINDYLETVVSERGVRWWADELLTTTPSGFDMIYKVWLEFTEEEETNGTAADMMLVISLKASS